MKKCERVMKNERWCWLKERGMCLRKSCKFSALRGVQATSFVAVQGALSYNKDVVTGRSFE